MTIASKQFISLLTKKHTQNLHETNDMCVCQKCKLVGNNNIERKLCELELALPSDKRT